MRPEYVAGETSTTRKQRLVRALATDLNMKQILIVSNFFYPEITPRAFRTTELVREFCRQGDQVTLVLPNKEVYRSSPFQAANLSILYSESPLIKIPVKNGNGSPPTTIAKKTPAKKAIGFLKKMVFYFFPKELFLLYDRGMTGVLRHLSGDFDALISISQPLSIHLSVSLALISNRSLNCRVAIAEFSDPMFKGDYLKTFPTNWLFGYFFSWIFDFFVVPVATAIPAFLYFKSGKRIKVIPQGFDISNIAANNYVPNPITTFAYAGRFYKDIRNPEYLFKFLEKVDADFVFKLYIPRNDEYFMHLIENYARRTRGKLLLCDVIPRDQLIGELGKVDFLVNFNNENAKMVPSKLIDYALTGRPIISFNSSTFSENIFSEFIARKYDNATAINLKDYDIKIVMRSFEELIN